MSLEVRGLHARYGVAEILHGIDLILRPGGTIGLLGPNAAGKTTFLRALSGLVPWSSGEIILDGVRINGMEPHERVLRGLVHVPERRGIFAGLTVEENLNLATIPVKYGRAEIPIAEIYELFPRLEDLRRQRAGRLSGGEQQMLAIGKALRLNPTVLLLDEPSTGLAPLIAEKVIDVLRVAVARGVAVLLAEQQIPSVLQLCERVMVIVSGRSVLAADRTQVTMDEIRAAYLGS